LKLPSIEGCDAGSSVDGEDGEGDWELGPDPVGASLLFEQELPSKVSATIRVPATGSRTGWIPRLNGLSLRPPRPCDAVKTLNGREMGF
jgi:hypothetical protein